VANHAQIRSAGARRRRIHGRRRVLHQVRVEAPTSFRFSGNTFYLISFCDLSVGGSRRAKGANKRRRGGVPWASRLSLLSRRQSSGGGRTSSPPL
jgi:hypothetical protein